MSRQKCLAWTLCILLASALSVKGDWQFQPAGIPLIHSIAADSSGQKLWLDAYGGGVWQTVDSGTTWQRNPELSLVNSGGGARVTPMSPTADTLLLANDERLLRRSVDGGATWITLLDSMGSGSYDPQIFFRPGNRHVWLYNSRYHLNRSADGGQVWSPVTVGNGQRVPLLYPSASGDTVLYALTYLGGTGNNTLYRSVDAGATWTATYTTLPSPLSVNFTHLTALHDGRLILCRQTLAPVMELLAPLASTDSGRTWSPWAVFPDPDWQPYSVIEDPATPGRLFAAGRFPGGFCWSPNGGDTWFSSADLPDTVNEGRLYVEPFSGTLYVSLVGGCLFQSRDGGSHWRKITLPLLGDGSYPAEMTATEDATYYSRNTYATQTALIPAMNMRLQTGAVQWQSRPLCPPGGRLTSWMLRDHADTLTCLTLRIDAGLPVTERDLSTDDGATWTSLRLPFYCNRYFHKSADGTGRQMAVGYCSGNSSQFDSLLLSVDGGESWHPASRWNGMREIGAVRWSPTALYLGTHDQISETTVRQVHESRDGGATWRQLGDDFANLADLIVLGDSVYAVDIATYTLRAWTGSAWQTRGANHARMAYLAVDAETPLLLASRPDTTTFWYSTDRGWTWNAFNATLPYADQVSGLFTLAYDAPRHRVWTTTSVGTAYLDVADFLPNATNARWKPADYTVLQCYPNPFNSSARIRYDLLQAGRVELTLYDLQGRLVKTLVDEVLIAGAHELKVDGSGLASGTYFVKLHTPAATRTEKLLLLK